MRRAILSIGAVFVAVGLAYGASQVWMTKPYQQWNENDVREILQHSPWIKEATVLASWGGSQSMQPGMPNEGQPRQQTQPPQTGSQGGTMGGGGGTMGGGGGTMGSGGGGYQQQGAGAQQPGMGQQPQTAEGRNATYIIRWNSAQTIRDAVARQAELSGKASQSQLQQYVDQQPNVYQVFVFGPDMTPFAQETTDTLKSKAYMEIKPTKEKVAPTAVEIVKPPNGGNITGVLFSFPKQGADGKPVIAPNDKEAHFDCKLKLAHLGANFDLRKMVGKNGQEL
ncbi:MAG TPA: hypothetical protein VN745_00135 [Verrucomicrobiae bacterium]|nr:hypothetical protein [Verrucomicrobiae bacterium]